MEDTQIMDLYWQRSERAITETDKKYGNLCMQIARNVLPSREDAEESVSDAYFAVWNALPPNRPAVFPAFLGKVTRRVSIDRWRGISASKRGGGQIFLCLEELQDCASPAPAVESRAQSRELGEAVNRFLDGLGKTERTVFVRRYFLMDPVADIGKSMGFSESKVTSMLRRTRLKLRTALEKEGYL